MAAGQVQKAPKPFLKAEGYHFFGPPGATVISVFLPLLVYTFVFVCNDISGCPAPSLLSPSTFRLEQLKREIGWPGIWGLGSVDATLWVLGYYLLIAVLYRILPATDVEGTPLVATGKRLSYRFNSLSSCTAILAGLAAGTAAQGANFPVWTYIDENYVQIVTANMMIAFFMATFCYVRSFSVKPGNADFRELAAGGHTGNLIYDWFIGRELNPRITLPFIGEVDIKQWFEIRPGLLGYAILNWAWVAKQYRTYGYATDSILFVTFIQTLYVVDCWWFEYAMLTQIDITTDGFGFMLSFGDIAWLPFIYSIPARYLSVHAVSLGVSGFAGVAAAAAVGFYIFRASNSQKNAFRTNPNDPAVAHLKYIDTDAGTRLITSGWWGTARHINYLGDWLQSWPYCLPTGFAGYMIMAPGHPLVDGALTMADGRQVVQGAARGWAVPITYFYILYFAVLLVHRELRDEEKCHNKYGKAWEKYTKIVRWRILPGIY